jgi:hypothetical protein
MTSKEIADAAEFERLFGLMEVARGEENVKVGPLSAVSPKTLESVRRVLMWNLRTVPATVHTSGRPNGQDERVALDFARAIQLAAKAEEGVCDE